MHRNFLILGGTGFVGRSVAEKLVERSGGAGGRIRVATRRFRPGPPSAAAADRGDRLRRRPRRGDAGARCCAGTDAVVNLVAILHGSEDEFERTHVRLPARLAAACQAAGVKRLVHVSALGAAHRRAEPLSALQGRAARQR